MYAIRNDFLSILYFLKNFCQVDHRTRNHLTPRGLGVLHWCTSLLCDIPKFDIFCQFLPPSLLQPRLLTCDSPSNHFSNYAIHYIYPLVGILSSYIHCSKHFIELLESLLPFPVNISHTLFRFALSQALYTITSRCMTYPPSPVGIKLIPVLYLKLKK